MFTGTLATNLNERDVEGALAFSEAHLNPGVRTELDPPRGSGSPHMPSGVSLSVSLVGLCVVIVIGCIATMPPKVIPAERVRAAMAGMDELASHRATTMVPVTSPGTDASKRNEAIRVSSSSKRNTSSANRDPSAQGRKAGSVASKTDVSDPQDRLAEDAGPSTSVDPDGSQPLQTMPDLQQLRQWHQRM